MLKTILENHGTNLHELSNNMETITRPTLTKYQNTPGYYNMVQLKEMAGLMGIGTLQLLGELGLIDKPPRTINGIWS